MFFPVITNNLNREILTKNLVPFKRWDGVNWFTKNQYIGGNCLKRQAWTVCRFKGGRTWKKRREGVIPQCTVSVPCGTDSVDTEEEGIYVLFDYPDDLEVKTWLLSLQSLGSEYSNGKCTIIGIRWRITEYRIICQNIP